MKHIAEFTSKEIFEYPLSSSYKVKNDLGCFYMIKNIISNKKYIGRTKAFYSRMRHHIHNSNRNKGILIDKSMFNNIKNFKFYILITYKNANINFFTRKNSTIIEQNLIKKYNTATPNGYNERIYT